MSLFASKNDPPAVKAAKIGAWSAVSAAVLAALIQVLGPSIGLPPLFGPQKKQITGVVFDSNTKTTLSKVVVQCETADGVRLNQDTTDNAGNFHCEVPKGIAEVRLVASVAGYKPYDQKLPGESLKNDIALIPLPLSFGIPSDTQLDEALEIVASAFNVTAVFSKTCTKKQLVVRVNGSQIQAESPEMAIKMLLDTVKDNQIRYKVTTLQPGRRYEVGCN